MALCLNRINLSVVPMEGVGDGSEALSRRGLPEEFTTGGTLSGRWCGFCRALPDGWDQRRNLLNVAQEVWWYDQTAADRPQGPREGERAAQDDCRSSGTRQVVPEGIPRCAMSKCWRHHTAPSLMQPFCIEQIGALLPRQLVKFVPAFDSQQSSARIIV